MTRTPQPYPGMLQECDGERGLAPDAPAARSNGVPQRPDVRRVEVGRFAGFQIAPEEFDGVEIRRVDSRTFDVQPATLRAESIPDEHDTLAIRNSTQNINTALRAAYDQRIISWREN